VRSPAYSNPEIWRQAVAKMINTHTHFIGVAEYQLKSTLPKELKGKLPTPKELSQALGLAAKRKKRGGGE